MATSKKKTILYRPSAKSAEAAILEAMYYSDFVYAFIHGQSPWFSA